MYDHRTIDHSFSISIICQFVGYHHARAVDDDASCLIEDLAPQTIATLDDASLDAYHNE